MLFDMRANSKYQLGFSKMPERFREHEKDSIASLVPPFSPYIVVDHKHGQRLHLTRQKEAGEGEEEEEEEIIYGIGSVTCIHVGLLQDLFWLKELFYLKAHPFGNHYPKWMSFLPLDCGQDLNPCAWEPLGSQSACGSTVP